jgi:hypothetical protein
MVLENGRRLFMATQNYDGHAVRDSQILLANNCLVYLVRDGITVAGPVALTMVASMEERRVLPQVVR